MKGTESAIKFDITKGERIQYGYYAALESIVEQYIGKLEAFFFDDFGLSLRFEYQINNGKKFRDVHKEMPLYCPMFVFELSPLRGESLLVIDNKSANLLLSKMHLQRDGKITLKNRFTLDTSKRSAIEHQVKELLSRFESSWSNIFKVKCVLKKLVSHKIKAKVMSPLEACVSIQINAHYHDFKAEWVFYFSAYQLDSIMKTYRNKALLLGEGGDWEDKYIKEYLSGLLTGASEYEAKGVLGKLKISQKQLLESYQQGTVLPIVNPINTNVEIQLNNQPMLAGTLGATNEKIALQINGRYQVVVEEVKMQGKPFQQIRFSTSGKI